MVIKRIFFALALLLLVAPVAHAAKDKCTDAKPEGYQPVAQRIADGTDKSLLWRVERCNYPVSYVFGTLHSDSPRLDPVFKQAAHALGKVSQLALEIEMTPQVQSKAISTMMLPSVHAGLQSLIPRPLFDQVAVKFGAILSQNPDQINRFTPWGLALIVQYPKSEADGIVLDQKLQNAAKAAFKRRVSLESIDEQMNVFLSLTPEDQQHFLEATLADIDSLDQQFAELFMHYTALDLNAIHRMGETMFDSVAARYPSLAKTLRKSLIDERNDRMAANSIKRLGRSTLIAVGALHLPGKRGLLAQLEKEGFQIYAVDGKAYEAQADADAEKARRKPRFKSVFDD